MKKEKFHLIRQTQHERELVEPGDLVEIYKYDDSINSIYMGIASLSAINILKEVPYSNKCFIDLVPDTIEIPLPCKELLLMGSFRQAIKYNKDYLAQYTYFLYKNNIVIFSEYYNDLDFVINKIK